MICAACKDNNHDECSGGDCQCPDFLERKNTEAEVTAVSRADAMYAETVLANLQNSSIARLIINGAGREQAKVFVHQILRTAKAMNC
jgi:hypothetical protein